jgi:hypothetical protein
MSHFKSDDHDPEGCEGCKPVVFDPKRKTIHDEMTAKAIKIYESMTPESRRAWHRVTCLNSRDPIDIQQAEILVESLNKAMAN